MADDKIVHRISLEGAEDVANKLKKIGDVSSDAFKKVQQSVGDSHSGIGKLGDAFAGIEGKTEGSRLAAERLREALHMLHPVLDAAGLGLGNLGSFARIGFTGMGTLAAAVIGSVVVGLAKLADQADIAKKKLADLGAGKSAFAGLAEDAKRLGSDATNLQGVFEQALKLRKDLTTNRSVTYAPGAEPFNQPDSRLSDAKLRTMSSTLLSLAQAAKADDPAKLAADFIAGVRQAKGLTGDNLRGAAATSEGFANSVARSLPNGFAGYREAAQYLDRGGKVGPEDLIQSLTKIAPQAEQAAKEVRGLTEAFDGAGASFKALVKEVSGDDLGKDLTQQVDRASGAMRRLEETIDRVRAKGNLGKGSATIPEDSIIGRILGIKNPKKSAKEHVAEEFNQLQPQSADGTAAAPGAAPDASAPAAAPGGAAASGPIIPKFNDDGTANPYGGQPNTRPNPDDGYTHPYAQAPNNEAERQQQQRESAVIGKQEAEYQKLFNQNIRDQNGGNNPSLDKFTYKPPVHGHYDPQSQKFIANPHQPAHDPSLVPGAPLPTTFPTYQRELTKEFQGKGNATVPGDPADIKIRPIIDDNDGYAGGGHIRGQGSSTSDSIPAMLSDGEYVLKADTVKRVGVENLNAVNSGVAHFAAGGNVSANSTELSPGQHDIADDGAGGATIDGVDYPKGSAILQNPLVQQGIAASLKPQKQEKKHKYHSPFITTDEDRREADQAGQAYDAWNAAPSNNAKGGLISHFAKGGLVGDSAQHFAKGGVASATFADRISAMGLSTIDVPHLAIGGMPDLSPPTLSEDSSVFKNASKGDGPLHPVTLNLPAGGSVDGVFAKPDAVAQLRAAANQAKRFSTGSKPGWYGGTAR